MSPGGCFMKRQQLVRLFLSLSGCSAHMIPGIDWRNLLFFMSLFPVLHLILYFTLSFGCLSFSYLDCLSFYLNQSSLRLYWNRVCLDFYLGSLNLTWGFYRGQGNLNFWVSTRTKATFPRGVRGRRGMVPWLSVCSVWSSGYGGNVGQEGAEGFIPESIPLRHKSGMSHWEKKGNTHANSTQFPCFLQPI